MRQWLLRQIRQIVGTNRLAAEAAAMRARLDQAVSEIAGLGSGVEQSQSMILTLGSGINQAIDRLDGLRTETGELKARLDEFTKYEVLPGTAYSRYALPLEYKPSRDLGPRWGNRRPVIAPLADWFGRYDEDYRRLLQAIRARAPTLQKIQRDFTHETPAAAWFGIPYAAFDSAALYTLIGETRPRTYLEIGSGATTAWARRSVDDHLLSTRIISIDPEPRAAINRLCDQVIRDGLENCDLAIFDTLVAGDIVFLDGSHRVFMNSDVTVFMIDVLPRLAPGVLVHIHDIVLPWDYHEMFTSWYWSEAYILAVHFMAGLDRIRPVFPTAWVCRSPQFADWFAEPLIDFGEDNRSWRDGGAMWFTSTAPPR